MSAQVRYTEIEPGDAGMRLDNYLRRVFKDVPKSRIYRVIRSGEVRVNAGRVRPGTRLKAQDRVRLPPLAQGPPRAGGRPPDALIARVADALIVEAPDYVVFSKPPDLAVHAGSGVRFGLIETLRAWRGNEYFELVHRLDRQTSGCLLVARSRPALNALAAALRAPTAQKEYLALVDGCWPHGDVRVDAALRRDAERGGERLVCPDAAGGRAARSDFCVEHAFDAATLLRVRLQTGRTHQIRAHAAYMGHPLAGDAKYGARERAARWRAFGLGRQFLHAARIGLASAAARVDVAAPLPAELAAVLARLESRP